MAVSPELIDRVGFTDSKLLAIMTLLGDEAASGEPTPRLFMEHLIDLLCLQLLRLHSSLSACASIALHIGASRRGK